MNQRKPLDNTDYLIVFGLLLVPNLVTVCRDASRLVCHVKRFNLPCLDSICSPHRFDLIGLIITTPFN